MAEARSGALVSELEQLELTLEDGFSELEAEVRRSESIGDLEARERLTEPGI